MFKIFRLFTLVIAFIVAAFFCVAFVLIFLGGVYGLVNNQANPVFREVFTTLQGLFNSLQILVLAFLSVITFVKLKNREKQYIKFALITFVGGYLTTVVYRLVFVTNWGFDMTELKNLVFFGVPLGILLLYNVLDKER